MPVCGSPKLIAAYHVLHRLSDPRHPPCALICFKKIKIYRFDFVKHYELLLQLFIPNMSKNFISNYSEILADDLELNQNIPKRIHLYQNNLSGGYRSRTDDPLRARQML
jgi:hypothetical protein